MNVVIIGAPSSGKGTQAEELAKEFGLFHFSSGDALRDEITSGSELGKKIKTIIDGGDLVSQDIIDVIVKSVVDSNDGVIFDGYPRTVDQAKALLNFTSIDIVVNILVADDVVIERMSSRRICSKCGTAYNLIFLPPRTSGKCDACGGELVMRDDDKPEVIKKRLELFHRNTNTILKLFRQCGVPVKNIDGTPSIDEVFASIKTVLEPFS